MDHIEQRTHSLQNATTVRLNLEIGMLGRELQISDQVGKQNCTSTPQSPMYLR